jgi:hypothetical protein
VKLPACAAALALAAAAACAGCGSNGPPTRAQALSYAERTSLRAGDYPGARTTGRVAPFDSAILGTVINRCGANLPNADERAVAISPTLVPAPLGAPLYPAYERSHLYSVVYVLDSEASAQRAVGALASPRTRACMAAAYRRAHASVRVHRVVLTPLAFALPGTRAVGMRETGAVTLTARPGAPVQHFQIDTLAFARGPVVVRLTASGIGGAPATDAERPLMELLLKRSRQAQL